DVHGESCVSSGRSTDDELRLEHLDGPSCGRLLEPPQEKARRAPAHLEGRLPDGRDRRLHHLHPRHVVEGDEREVAGDLPPARAPRSLSITTASQSEVASRRSASTTGTPRETSSSAVALDAGVMITPGARIERNVRAPASSSAASLWSPSRSIW